MLNSKQIISRVFSLLRSNFSYLLLLIIVILTSLFITLIPASAESELEKILATRSYSIMKDEERIVVNTKLFKEGRFEISVAPSTLGGHLFLSGTFACDDGSTIIPAQLMVSKVTDQNGKKSV